MLVDWYNIKEAAVYWLAELEGRQSNSMGEPSHVINIDIQDNHEEATIGAFMICDLCELVSSFCMWLNYLSLILSDVY